METGSNTRKHKKIKQSKRACTRRSFFFLNVTTWLQKRPDNIMELCQRESATIGYGAADVHNRHCGSAQQT